tara:strand:+ start:239 stop:955 length:717 start_codon:yes stop_codon:yes gene_type:complete
MSEVNEDGTPKADSAVEELTKKLEEATQKINKYDGERKDYSEQTNLIVNLTSQVEGLTEKLQAVEDEDTKHVSVTQEELRDFKAGESERFENHIKAKEDKVTADQAEYQKYLGQASLSVKDETLFDEICKEHDSLVASNAMPVSTGNMKADAQIAWSFAENALLRKKNAAGQAVTGFSKIEDVKTSQSPVVPGQQELSSASETKQTTTKMPDNLPDDAREFAALMGMDADSVNRGLAR